MNHQYMGTMPFTLYPGVFSLLFCFFLKAQLQKWDMKLSYQFPKRTILVDSLNYLTMNKVQLSPAIYQCLATLGVLILCGVAPMKTLRKQHGRTLWTFAFVELVSFILQFSLKHLLQKYTNTHFPTKLGSIQFRPNKKSPENPHCFNKHL